MKRIFIISAALLTFITLPSCFSSKCPADADIIFLIQKATPSDVEAYKELRKLGYSKKEALRLIRSINLK